MLWDAESLSSMIRSMSPITIMGGFNSMNRVCEGELVKMTELDALVGQEIEDNQVHR
jgi:hypothetical protein